MDRKVSRMAGRTHYNKHKWIIKPVFGQIKAGRGIRVSPELPNVDFFEFASVGALNTGVVMEIEVAGGATLFSEANVAIRANDSESAELLAERFDVHE